MSHKVRQARAEEAAELSALIYVSNQTKAQGIKTLELNADPAAVPFYEAMGWRETGNSPSGSISGGLLPKMAYVL